MSKYLPLFNPIYPIPGPVPPLPLPLPYLSLAAGRSQGLLTIAFCAAVTEIVLAAIASFVTGA